MTFWMWLFLNRLQVKLIFQPFCLILSPGKVMRSGLCSSVFLTPLRTLMLLVRLVLLSYLVEHGTGSPTTFIWLVTIFGLYVGKVRKMASSLMSKSGLLQILVVHLWQRSLTLILDFRVVRIAGNNLVIGQAVQQKKGCGRQCF